MSRTTKNLVLVAVLFFACIYSGVLFPKETRAQSFSSFDQNRLGATLDFSPEFPRPGEVVTATLNQFMSDPRYLMVTWKLNGEVVLQDYEAFTYTFTTGPVGSLFVLEAYMEDREGRTATAKQAFRVSDVAFMWEARSYTPPFYQGRPRLSYGAPAMIVVDPTIYSMDGTLYSDSQLSYVWLIGVQKKASGVGKNSLAVAPGTPFNNLAATVQIMDPEGVLRMVYNIDIPSLPPQLYIYEDDPLLGILYQKAIVDSYDLTKEEIKLVAEPLYTTVDTRLDPGLSYSWDVNGTNYEFPGSIILRPEGSLFGSTNISLTVINTKSILQRLQERITVTYSADGASNGSWTDPTTETL